MFNSVLSTLDSVSLTFNSILLDWDIDSFLDKLKTKITDWGTLLVVVVGLVMVIVGVVQVAKGLISHGKTQTNWVVAVLLIVVGGALAFGSGWGFVQNVAGGTGNSLEELGGVILPMFFNR